MGGKFLIYALSDPRTGEIRYVGKSCSGMKRPRQHTQSFMLQKDRTHKGCWLKGLGCDPLIEVVEDVAQREALVEAEKYWIAQFRALGFRLTNHLDGGEGGSTMAGRRHSEETKRKMSQSYRSYGANIGRRTSDETKVRISQSMKGRTSPLRGRPGHKNSPNLHLGKTFVDEAGVVYRSLMEAHLATGIPKSTIQAILKGKFNKGVFRYVDR